MQRRLRLAVAAGILAFLTLPGLQDTASAQVRVRRTKPPEPKPGEAPAPAPAATPDPLNPAIESRFPTTPLTFSKADPEWLVWQRAIAVDAFKKMAPDEWKTDDKALSFLDDLCRQRAGFLDAPSDTDLLFRGHDLVVNRHCPDALVRAEYFRLLAQKAGGDTNAREFANAASTLVVSTTYPWATRARIGVEALAKTQTEQRRAQGATNFADTVAVCLAKAASERDLTPLQSRALYRMVERPIDGGIPADMAQLLVSRLKQTRTAEPWLTLMCEARLQIRLAWDARGSGYARSVTEDGWRLFQQHLAAAHQCVQRAFESSPDRPEAATAMITLAMAGELKEPYGVKYWFTQATRAQSDWGPAYRATFFALAPRWGGTREDMVRFAVSCGQKDQNTLAPLWLVRGMYAIAEDAANREAFDTMFAGQEFFNDFHSLIAALEKAPANEHCFPFLASFDAATAWRTGRYAECREILETLGQRYHGDAEITTRVKYEDMVRDAYTIGLDDPAINAGLAAEKKKDWSAAARAFQTALDQTPADQPKRLFAVRERLTLAAVSRDLKEKGAAALTFLPDLPGYRTNDYPGFITFTVPERTPTPTFIGYGELHLRTDVGPRFAIAATIDIPDAAPQTCGNGFVPGFIVRGRTADGNYKYLRLQFALANGTVSLDGAGPGIQRHTGPMNPRSARISMEVFDRRIVAHINSAIVLDTTLPPDIDWNPGDRAALSFYYATEPSLAAAVRDVKIRTLGEVTQVPGE